VKFLVLMTEADHFARWDACSAAEQQAVFDCFRAFDEAVSARGEVVGGEALTRPEEARTLGPGDDRVVTDGPYAETVEQLGGFYLVDLPDLDAAVGAARLLPSAYTIEVRPVLPT
jgi:hypothetical protein